MGSKIYVGGLPYSTTESALKELFEPHGTVESVRVVSDKFTGKSRGFAFVEMSTEEEAEAAIAALNGTDLEGRTLAVSKARPQEPRTGGDRSGRDRGRSGPGRGRSGPGGRGRW
jgi:RNA recognition motif-containing protein